MELSVKGLRVIITAGAASIGRATAQLFLENGARVHICDISKKQLEACRKDLPAIKTTVADVANSAQIDQLFKDASEHLGGLDVLVNNAGISGPIGPVEQIRAEDWHRTMTVNIDSQFYCVRRAVPLLKAAGGGSIVNISSTAGLFGYPLRTPYAASKWAVIGFTKSLAMELGEYGIRVNGVCPGAIEGERMARIIEDEAKAQGVSPDQVRKGYLRQSSLRTFIDPEDIAQTILYLCSDAPGKISGQAVTVDGHTDTLRT